MKLILGTLILLFAIQINAQTFTISVNSGYGGGTYNSGDSAFVLANPTPDNFIFERWQTNTELSDTFCVATVVRNINANALLTPIYSVAPNWTETQDTINGSNVHYYFPSVASNLKGLILFFHGSNGNGESWFTKVENRTFLNYAVAKGYAVLSTESIDRISGGTQPWQWSNNSTVATNPDIQNVDKIIDTLNARGFINSSTKIYGVGFSQGSGFTSLIAGLKNYTANSLGATPGINQVITETLSPTYWMSSSKDENADPLRLEKCITNYNTLVARGIDAELRIHLPFPVTPNRFWRIPTIDSVLSNDIYNRLLAGNHLDNQHFVNFNPDANTAWTGILQPTYATQVGEIEDQVIICYTEHKFHSDQMYYIIQFFDRYANDISSNLPENSEGNFISVFPNPTTKEINISIPSTDNFTLALQNTLGETVLQSQNQSKIDVSALARGIYFIKVTFNNKIFSQKIIIQ